MVEFYFFIFCFVFRNVVIGPAPLYVEPAPISYLDDFNDDFVGPGGAFNANRPYACPSILFLFFTAARSLALRARGLVAVSVELAVTGLLVNSCNSAS
jgi:hypothetical protein